jgi:uncharacterized membrane protein
MKNRLAFIDILRGWAVLVMIEVHVFNAYLLSSIRSTSWFEVLNFINGLVAPSFIFISGFIFTFTSQKKLESFRTFGSPFWKQLGRIGFIWMIGYFLHLPAATFQQMMTETTERDWLIFYQSDVLHCIAFGLLYLFIFRILIHSDRTYRTFLMISGFVVLITTKFIWDINFLRWLHPAFAAYFNNQNISLFPLFPWMAFILFGGFFATGYIRARENQVEKKYIQSFGIIAIGIILLSIFGRQLSLEQGVGSSDIRASILFFFERLGIVMFLLCACWYYADYRKTEKSFILDASKESLLVYSLHLYVIYGFVWNGQRLVSIYGKASGVLECLIGTIVLVLFMIIAAKIWGWLKHNHSPFARGLFWMSAGTYFIWFFSH